MPYDPAKTGKSKAAQDADKASCPGQKHDGILDLGQMRFQAAEAFLELS